MNRPDLPNKPKPAPPAPKSLTKAELREALRTPYGVRKTNKNGGARNPAVSCVSMLLKVLPDENDYARMVDLECESIDTTKTYKEFVNGQREKAKALDKEDCDFLFALCARVLKRKVYHVDLEGCNPFQTTIVFLDNNSNFVTGNER